MKRDIPEPREPEDNRVIPPWLHELRRHAWAKVHLPVGIWGGMRNRQRRWLLSREIGDMTETPGLRDKAFNKHSRNSGHHVSPLGNNKVQVGTDGIVVRLVQGIDVENLKRVLSMTTRATIGWDPEDVSEDNRDWSEMLRGGLQTALESQVIVFAVSGVSRTCTHQIVRTRKAAFHQSSQRASYLGDQPETRVPESVWRKGPELVRIWLAAIEAAQDAYRAACESDVAYQDARFILPEGTDNFIVLEYPLRELIAVYNYRACYMFQWEISHVMHECKRVLLESIDDPEVKEAIDNALRISCEKTGPAVISQALQVGEHGRLVQGHAATVPHHCTFQGWESPEGQCPLPWALDAARTFKPKHHNI